MMAALSIRNLDDDVRERLRARALSNGRSMEAEARDIITRAVSEPEQPEGWVAELIARFAAIGGVELDIPPRSARARQLEFDP
jgi:antitoxin FitA